MAELRTKSRLLYESIFSFSSHLSCTDNMLQSLNTYLQIVQLISVWAYLRKWEKTIHTDAVIHICVESYCLSVFWRINVNWFGLSMWNSITVTNNQILTIISSRCGFTKYLCIHRLYDNAVILLVLLCVFYHFCFTGYFIYLLHVRSHPCGWIFMNLLLYSTCIFYGCSHHRTNSVKDNPV